MYRFYIKMQTSVWFYLFGGGSMFSRGLKRTTPRKRNGTGQYLQSGPAHYTSITRFSFWKCFNMLLFWWYDSDVENHFLYLVLYRFLLNSGPAHNIVRLNVLTLSCLHFRHKLKHYYHCFVWKSYLSLDVRTHKCVSSYRVVICTLQ